MLHSLFIVTLSNMISLTLVFLFIFGTIFGSFSSVLIHRFKTGEGGIVNGRSHCGSCGHTLSALDLVPLFSWIFSRGKCRYCDHKVSPIYPLLELAMGILFVICGSLFVDIWAIISGNLTEILVLLFWLFVSFVSVVIVFYDIAYMEIPDGFLLASIAILVGLGVIFPHEAIFRHILPIENLSIFENGFLGALGIYTFFYILFAIPFVVYFIRKQKWKDLCILFGYYFYLIPEAVYESIIPKKTKETSQTEEDEDAPAGWIGLWDLRIGIFMGLVCGAKIAALALFLSYIVWSIISIGVLLFTSRKNERHEVPFGPFLIIGMFLALSFYDRVVSLIFPSL